MKNWKLESIRGAAAVMVFFCHLVLNNSILKQKTFLNIIGNWGTEAVIIFFILSGIVINISQKKNPRNTYKFIRNRILRIYPLYFIGIILAALVLEITKTEFYNPNIFIGNLLFVGTLQGYIIQVPSTNPVVWSLTFEMFFYLIYSFGINKYQKKFMAVWCVLSVLCIPLYYLNIEGVWGHLIAMFSFSSIWLVGYYVYEFSYLFKITDFKVALLFGSLLPGISRLNFSSLYYDVFKYLIFALVSTPLFLYCLRDYNSTDNKKIFYISRDHAFVVMFITFCGIIFLSNSLVTSKFIYIIVPILFFLCTFKKYNENKKVLNLIKKSALFSGQISYSLYIIHFPILLLLNYYVGNNLYLYLIVSLILVFSLSFMLESKYQTFVVSLFRRKNS